MKPQEWVSCVREASKQLENLEFLQEGATHLASALAERAALRSEVERLKVAPVVVPENAAWLTRPEMANALVQEFGMPENDAFRYARTIAKASVKKGSRLRTIGPGEVVVSEKELNVLLILERYARKHGPESIDYAIEALDALRSQKECQP